jgi:hypothetical protein
MTQDPSIRRMQNDLLVEIKRRVASDAAFRDAFFENPEAAIESSDLASNADALRSARGDTRVAARPGECTWTCAWTE